MRVPQRQTELLWRFLCLCLVITWFGAGMACWTGCEQPNTPTTSSAEEATSEQPSAPEAPEPEPARDVLNAMVAAYKEADSYDDMGYIEIQYQLDGEPLGDAANFMVAMARPNKIRVQAYAGVAVSDGQKLWGAVKKISDQVLQRDAPAELTVESLSFNHILSDALAQG
ncbi:MAG: hypothetical protein HQ582_03700, partial [Planctomycetes bacterium]|nr:hypothetical protein [Planctomycetota bacterium]